MAQYIEYPAKYLSLDYTLTCGQAFRWKLDDEGWWTAAISDKLVRIRRHDDGFMWETYPGEPDEDLITHYFRLDDDVPAIFADLAARDPHMASLLKRYQGLRILRQDPEETLLSYVCSTANSVTRISRAVDEISRRYGRYIADLAGRHYYSFPTIQALVKADPDDLAAIGSLAWRGRSLWSVTQQLLELGDGWAQSLRAATYEDAKAELVSLRGIGAKIADCVCLFSLDKDQAVPVDTHIRQVAVRHFMPDLKAKTVTPSVYNTISRAFVERFGQYAGWAQEYLFLEDFSRKRARTGLEEEAQEATDEE